MMFCSVQCIYSVFVSVISNIDRLLMRDFPSLFCDLALEIWNRFCAEHRAHLGRQRCPGMPCGRAAFLGRAGPVAAACGDALLCRLAPEL